MRREIEGRPLLIFSFGLVGGIATWYGWWHLLAVPIAAGALSNASLRWTLVAGVGLGLLSRPVVSASLLVESKPFAGEVVLLEMPRDTAFGVRVLAGTDFGRVALSLPKASPAVLGERLAVRGELRPLSEASELTWRRKGAFADLRTSSARSLGGGAVPWRWGLAVRRSFVEFVTRVLPQDSASVIDAICFNQDGELEPAMSERLRRSGIIHIVSTSGLHVMMLAAMLLFLFSRLPIPRTGQLVLVTAILLVYIAAAGLRPPAMRALLMTVVFLAAYRFDREGDGLSALALAAIVTLLVSPEGVVDPGLHLSFTIMAALVLFWERRPIVAKTAWGAVVAGARALGSSSLVAFVASAPLLAYHFGQVSLMAIVGNLLVAPVLPFLIGGALLAWVVGGVWFTGGVGVLIATSGLAGWIRLVADTLGSFEGTVIHVPPFSGYWLIPIYGCMVLLWQPIARPADA
ncbi:MAG TPA: ComEC/Rec2 family competence protein [Fimbriimonadaceae bacterium]|nr:ComEC/Rec2 family competence protein [Fimbriimonadaceae bacterium]